MKTTIVAAISKDGFLTKGENPNPSDWTSDEDKAFYGSMLANHDLYIMGYTTFKLSKNSLPKHAQIIVMCFEPDKQPKLPGVYFSDKTFESTINKFSYTHSHLLVLGGASIYHQMLEENLVDEAFITVEPIVHHSGVLLCDPENYFENSGFELASKKELNYKGTVLNHYILKK